MPWLRARRRWWVGVGFAVLSCLVWQTDAYAGPESTVTWVTATAYNSVPGQTDSTPWIAAWGDRLSPNMKIIAVSRDLLGEGWLTRGTRVRIEGLDGEYRVLDKMNARFSNRIDVYMGSDLERARRWGVREVRIEWTRP